MHIGNKRREREKARLDISNAIKIKCPHGRYRNEWHLHMHEMKCKKKSRTIQCALIKCTQSIFINESLWTGFIELSVDYNLKQMLWANGENGISKSGWCSRQIRADIFCNSFFIGKFIPPESMTALCASLFFRSLVCKYILLSLYRNIGRLSRTILWRRRLNFILFVDAAAQFIVFLLKIEMSQSGNKKVNHAESNEMKWNERRRRKTVGSNKSAHALYQIR